MKVALHSESSPVVEFLLHGLQGAPGLQAERIATKVNTIEVVANFGLHKLIAKMPQRIVVVTKVREFEIRFVIQY